MIEMPGGRTRITPAPQPDGSLRFDIEITDGSSGKAVIDGDRQGEVSLWWLNEFNLSPAASDRLRRLEHPV